MSLPQVWPDDPIAQLPDAARYRLYAVYGRVHAGFTEGCLRLNADHAARHDDCFPCPHCVPEYRALSLSTAEKVIRAEFDEFSRIPALQARLLNVMRGQVDSVGSTYELDESAETYLNRLVISWLNERSAAECSFPEAAEARLLSRAHAIRNRGPIDQNDPQGDLWQRIVEIWQACNDELRSSGVQSEREQQNLAHPKTFDICLNFGWVKWPSFRVPPGDRAAQREAVAREKEAFRERFRVGLMAHVRGNNTSKPDSTDETPQPSLTPREHLDAHIKHAKATGEGFTKVVDFGKSIPGLDMSDLYKILKTGTLDK
jgi:hypothetical protein